MEAQHYSHEDILGLDQRFRNAFINCLSGFKSATLVGTQSADGLTNLAIISSIVHIGANPPMQGFIHRPTSVEKHTFMNIEETGSFTLNHVSKAFFPQAHQTSARYDREVSEFEATGLTPWYGAVSAPYVEESLIKMGFSLQDIIPIPINGTWLIVGKLEEVFVPSTAIASDGWVDLTASGTLAVNGLDGYGEVTSLGRLAYAKPDVPPTFV